MASQIIALNLRHRSWINRIRSRSASLLVLTAFCCLACGDSNKTVPNGTTALCGRALAGDKTINDQADADAMQSVTHVQGDLLICDADNLNSVLLPNLTRIDGNLIIYRNAILALVEMPALTSVGQAPNPLRGWQGLLLGDNNSLSAVTLPELNVMEGHLWVSGNTKLAEFDLPALTRVSGTMTLKSTQITIISGFASLHSLGGSILIQENLVLTSIGGFGNLQIIGDDLLLTGNVLLTSASFPAATTIGRSLGAGENPVLATLNLVAVEQVGTQIDLDGTALANLDGLGALTFVGADLSLTNNEALLNVTLPLLTMVGGAAIFTDNAALTDLNLLTLGSIGEELEIINNVTLDTIDMTALTALGGNLSVLNNTLLPTCAAELLRDGITTFAGTAAIAGNNDAGVCL